MPAIFQTCRPRLSRRPRCIACPQVVERILPFCVLIGAMSCYLNLSRRLGQVVARSTGISAWQFVMPAIVAAFVFPVSSPPPFTINIGHFAGALEALRSCFRADCRCARPEQRHPAFWMNQRADGGESSTQLPAATKASISMACRFTCSDIDGRFKQRIEARAAVLVPGAWVLRDTLYGLGTVPTNEPEYRLKPVSLPSKSAKALPPETVPFWDLPVYIEIAEHAGLWRQATDYSFKALARPFC